MFDERGIQDHLRELNESLNGRGINLSHLRSYVLTGIRGTWSPCPAHKHFAVLKEFVKRLLQEEIE